MISRPKVEERAEQPYVAKRTHVAMDDLGSVIDHAVGDLYAWLGQQGVAPAGPFFIRYLVIDMAGKRDLEMGFPVASALSGDGRICAGVLPAGRYASLVYTGPYDGLVEANAALLDWGAEQGLAWDTWAAENGDGFGARFESYLTDPSTEPDPTKWETEVAIRVADAQPR
jgi:effector-binding domain-containing protein